MDNTKHIPPPNLVPDKKQRKADLKQLWLSRPLSKLNEQQCWRKCWQDKQETLASAFSNQGWLAVGSNEHLLQKKKKKKKKRVPVITVSTLSYKMLKKQETIKKEKRNGLQENTYK
jgi:hypothetical protein